MPTIRKRNGKYQAQARRTGYVPQSKSFDTKAAAVRWAKDTEAILEKVSIESEDEHTLRDILQKYLSEVSPSRKSYKHDTACVRNLCRYSFVDNSLDSLTVDNLESYRKDRLLSCKTSTVAWDESFLKRVLLHYKLSDLTSQLPKLRLPASRSRRLETYEMKALLAVPCRTPQLRTMILLAIETGMRLGEITRLTWEHIDLVKSVLHIPDTKTGYSRSIPLTSYAVQLLQEQPKVSLRVFQASQKALIQGWERICSKAARTNPSLHTLTFHDLRHEAISRFFELGLNVPEVALISGHRNPSNLFRYTHIKPEHVATKLLKLQDANA